MLQISVNLSLLRHVVRCSQTENMEKVTHSIKDYIDRNAKRKNLHWKFSNGELMFKHRNKWYGADLLNKYYPKYDYRKFNLKGENPNKKAIY